MSTTKPSFWELPDRRIALAASLAAGIAFVTLLTFVLPDDAAVMLLDRPRAGGAETTLGIPYPFTIQNLTHLLLFVGLGEIFLRWRVTRREERFLKQSYLPQDETTVLQAHDLGSIRKRVSGEYDETHGFLPYLIDLSVLQFFTGRSVDQTVTVMNSTLGLLGDRVDLRYTMLRYLSWLIPTVGFIGTVVGISKTLAGAAKVADPSLQAMADTLSVAFNTTMVALLESAILVFLIQVIEAREEGAVSSAGNYCLKNLITRLHAG